MSASAPAEGDQRRFNPFAFPSDTDFRFVLLCAAVIVSSSFIFRWINNRYDEEFGSYALSCLNRFDTSQAADLDELLATQSLYETCMVPAYSSIIRWWGIGLGLELLVAVGIYWIQPAWKIRRDRLIPLRHEDAPEVVEDLKALCAKVGLERPPEFLWNPLKAASSGVAFGRFRRKYIALTGGLVSQFYVDRPAFHAVVLHELAHLKNGDVDKTYFTIALWRAFLLVVLAPLVVTQLFPNPLAALQNFSVIFNLGIRTLVLVLGVFLIRNAVLRSREYYADVRALTWETQTGAMNRVLGLLPGDEPDRLAGLTRVHPTAAQRKHILNDTSPLFNMGFWDALSTGGIVGIAFPSLEIFFSILLTGTHNTQLAPMLASFLLAPLIIGVVGLGVWRLKMLTLTQDTVTPDIGILAVGLGVGIILGRALSYEAFVESYSLAMDLISRLTGALFTVVWSVTLIGLLYLFLRWILTSASLWLRVATKFRSPRRIYLYGLPIASLVLIIWLSPLLWMSKYNASLSEILLTIGISLASIPTLFVMSPLTFAAFAGLWAFPLAAWIWGKRSIPRPDSSWVYLGGNHILLSEETASHTQLRPDFAALLGLLGGATYGGLLLMVRIMLRLFLSETVSQTDGYKLTLYFGGIVFGIMIQAIVAAFVASSVKKEGALHGLLAGFVAGVSMAVIFLILNVMFGGQIDLQFTWQVLAHMVNGGLLLTLPVAVVVDFWYARRRKSRPAVV